MRQTSINDLASLGLNKDRKPWQLAPEEFTLLDNVRFTDDGIERLLGHEQVFGTMPDEPHFIMPVTGPTQLFWLYTSLDKGYVYDGVNHTDITRLSGDYNASETRDWNGTMLGGIPILNNGIDIPQYWVDYDLGEELADLPDWPSTIRARIVRALGPFLMMFNVTDGGVQYPHRVRWSHPADPGTVPISYDITDPAFDAGEIDLTDANAGQIIDALPLGGAMFVYKEGSTHRMRFVGGEYIFAEDTFLETVGLLASRCVAITDDGQRHVMLTQDDLVVHNGQTAQGLLDSRMRRTLFNQIDPDNYVNSFVFCNPLYKEIWACYPTIGNEMPDRALIWNYAGGGQGAISEADVDFANVDIGSLQLAGDGSWDADTGDWNSDQSLWNRSSRRKLVAVKPLQQKAVQLDVGQTRDGVSFGWTVAREALGVFGETRSRRPIVDITKVKQFDRIWPKATGVECNVRIGFRDKLDEATNWNVAQAFDPTIHNYCDAEGSGRLISIEYSSLTDGPWRLDGYDVEMEPGSEF